MTDIYEDVNYIELLNTMTPNEELKINVKIDEHVYYEHPDDVAKIFEYVIQINMFEKLLKETLENLNETNPALETGKYHMLCIEANRYSKYINYYKYQILTYEWKITRKRHRDYKNYIWEWCWKLMTYFKKHPETITTYKNHIDKKKD